MNKNPWFAEDLTLSFVVLFSKINPNDSLRVFHKDQLIDEIICDSKIKKIDISIAYQSDIQFEMQSYDNENVCEFYFASINPPLSSKHRFWHFLFTKTKWGLANVLPDNARYFHDIDYYISLFGSQIHGAIARPDFKNRICWQSNLKLQNKNSDKHWIDHQCNESFIKITGLLIANFIPGIICFYRNPYSNLFHINIFKDVKYDLNNNSVQLTKTTGKSTIMSIDRLLKIKNISQENEYLNFIWNCLAIWPSMTLSMYNLRS